MNVCMYMYVYMYVCILLLSSHSQLKSQIALIVG